MTLELDCNTEPGAVIDKNKDTRRIAICIAIQVFHITIYGSTIFDISLHPIKIPLYLKFTNVFYLELVLTLEQTGSPYYGTIVKP